MGCIVLVDDESFIVEVLWERLTVAGFSVIGFDSSVKALQKLKEQAPNIDLCLFDISMPDMSGYALAEAVRAIEKYKAVPIWFITGNSLDECEEEIRTRHLTDTRLFPKPVDFPKLLQDIKGFLRV